MSNIVLCADDSKTLQTVAEITFRVSDYQYVGAKSADEALEKARAQKPALVLADAGMPGKTGYDLCAALKQEPSLADVPVVLLCGNGSPYDASRAAEVGAIGHVSKPWDTQVMLDKVAELLGQASAAPAAAKPVVPKPPILPEQSPSLAPAGQGADKAGKRPHRTMMGMPQVALPGEPKSAEPAAAQAPSKRAPSVAGSPRPATAPPGASARPATGAPRPAAPRPGTSPRAATGAPRPGGGRRPTGVPQRAPTNQPTTQLPRTDAVPGVNPKAAPAATLRGSPTPSAGAAGAAPTPPQSPPLAVAPPAPAPAPAPAPVAAAAPAAAAPPKAVGRMPMIRGLPRRQGPLPMRPLVTASAVAKAQAVATQVAQEAGLAADGPEVKALLALSTDVVERIVWEVVPELAETIIRENLSSLTAKQ